MTVYGLCCQHDSVLITIALCHYWLRECTLLLGAKRGSQTIYKSDFELLPNIDIRARRVLQLESREPLVAPRGQMRFKSCEDLIDKFNLLFALQPGLVSISPHLPDREACGRT